MTRALGALLVAVSLPGIAGAQTATPPPAPPTITITSPEVGQSASPLPWISISYSADPSVGVDLTKLSVFVNGVDWTSKFSAGSTGATYTAVASDGVVAGPGRLHIVAKIADTAGIPATDDETYDVVPILQSLDKATGLPGDTLTVTAVGLDPSFAQNALRFSGAVTSALDAPFTAVSAGGTQGSAVVPDTAISSFVQLVVNGAVSYEGSWFRIPPALDDCGFPQKILPMADGSFLVRVPGGTSCAPSGFGQSVILKQTPSGSTAMEILSPYDPVDPSKSFFLVDYAVDKTGLAYALLGTTIDFLQTGFLTIRYHGIDTKIDPVALGTTLTPHAEGGCPVPPTIHLPIVVFPASDFDVDGNFYFAGTTSEYHTGLGGAGWSNECDTVDQSYDPDTVNVYRVSKASLDAGGLQPVEMIAGGLASITPVLDPFAAQATRVGAAEDLRIDCQGNGYVGVLNGDWKSAQVATFSTGSGGGTGGAVGIPSSLVPTSITPSVTPGQVWVSGFTLDTSNPHSPFGPNSLPEITSSTGYAATVAGEGFFAGATAEPSTLTQNGSVLWYRPGAGFVQVPVPQSQRVVPKDIGGGVVTAQACPCKGTGSAGALAISPAPSTTRWLPAKDTTQDAKISFTASLDAGDFIQNATITLAGRTSVAPITATFTSGQDPYTVAWKAGMRCANPQDVSTCPTSGDYTISITATTKNGKQLASSSSGPNATISLVEVSNVSLASACGLSGNPAVGAPPGQAPAQDRAYKDPSDPAATYQGGLRIFAEAPSNPIQGGTLCNQVTITATTRPPVPEGVPVYFQSLDVSDPNPPEPNENHNQGMPPQGNLSPTSVTVPANQTQVQSVLTVSSAPGDNYRVVASTSQAWLSSVQAVVPSPIGRISVPVHDYPTASYCNVDDTGAPIASDSCNVSPMLTVWRTLHLEVDSMKAPPDPNDSASASAPQRNFIDGTITSIGKVFHFPPTSGIPDQPTRITVSADAELDDGSPELDNANGHGFDDGRFQNGTIRIGTGDGAIIKKPLKGNGSDYVKGVFDLPFTLRKGNTSATGRVLGWNSTAQEFTLDSVLKGTPEYKGGSFTLAGVTWTVVAAAGTHVRVLEDQAIPFRLTDDDAAQAPFDTTSALLTDCHGDAGCEADPERNILGQAYIRVRYDLPASGKTAPFSRNIPADVIAWAIKLAQGRDSTTVNSPAFWVGYVQGAFQETAYFKDPDTNDVSGDLDPDGELGPIGATPQNGTVLPDGTVWDGFGVLIFRETIHDQAQPVNLIASFCQADQTESQVLSETVAHEIGHTFGLQHPIGGGPDAGIMNIGCVLPHYFAPSGLWQIRQRRSTQ